MSHYEIIIQKLDAFIRKYYLNQLIRGSLIFLAAILLYVLLVTVGEYFFYFSIRVKWTLLVFLLGLGLFALVIWVIIPLLKIRKLGKVISHEQAATIVGDFFPEVEDKLLNVLQLKKQPISTFESQELIAASIDQRAGKISVLSFGSAVDLRKNRKYLPYLAIPVLTGILIFIFAPKIFTEGGYRLAQPSVLFAKPAPFTFEILNKNFDLVQGQSFTLQAQFKGEKLPQQMFVEIEGEQIEMQIEKPGTYTYTFEKVYKNTRFRLYAAEYYTEPYTLRVKLKPELQQMQMTLNYPAYTGKPNEVLQGLSDISVPAGTTITWNLQAAHTDAIKVLAGSVDQSFVKSQDKFYASVKFISSLPYYLLLSNQQQAQVDTLKYNVQVIEDQYPQVDIQVLKDSTLSQQILITGTAGDDYLVRQNLFVYQVLDQNQKVVKTGNVALKSGAQVVQFTHYFDVGTLRLAPGQQVNYFVEVWDNDAVNGSKSRRSQVMSWKAPALYEMDKAMTENAEKMNASMSTSAAQAEALREEFKDMQKELMDQNSSSWERNQKMQSMLDKNLQIKQNLENLKKRFEEQQKQADAKNLSEDFKEKQEAIKEQIDNLKDKQLEEQLQKLQEMLQQKNQQNQMQQMQQMEQKNKLFQMDMERLQELMKKLEMQLNMENMAKQLDQLAEKQNKIEAATDKGQQSNETLKKEQDALKKELEKVMKEGAEKIAAQNDKLEKPQDLKDMEAVKEQGKDAASDMEESSDQLQQNNKSAAKKSQQQAKNKLAEMSKKMAGMSGSMDMEQVELDIKATRQLLTNLIRFSFDQEALMNKLRRTNPASPQYIALTKEQNRLKNNTAMIKDSLFALSKRIFQIAATINKETSDLDNRIAQALSTLEAKRTGEVLTHQQYAMTAANNLALLLNELLANLMQQSSSGSGSGSSGKPQKGKGQSSGSGMMKDIITGQQEMGKGLNGMKQGQEGGGQQQGGQQPNGQPGGNSQGQGQGSSQSGGSEGQAEQVARLAQQQAMLRKQLQDLNNLLNSKGMGGGTVSKEIRDIQAAMDKMETDLVYRKDPSELIRRNKEILTRMLEAEKAIQEQEEDNKRSAEAGKDAPRPIPSELSEHLRQQQQLFEQYKKGLPALKPFYQKMAEEYLRKVQQP